MCPDFIASCRQELEQNRKVRVAALEGLPCHLHEWVNVCMCVCVCRDRRADSSGQQQLRSIIASLTSSSLASKLDLRFPFFGSGTHECVIVTFLQYNYLRHRSAAHKKNLGFFALHSTLFRSDSQLRKISRQHSSQPESRLIVFIARCRVIFVLGPFLLLVFALISNNFHQVWKARVNDNSTISWNFFWKHFSCIYFFLFFFLLYRIVVPQTFAPQNPLTYFLIDLSHFRILLAGHLIDFHSLGRWNLNR